ncbi:hypothetical protein B0T10DRAFT_485107 [Thelonectria olida]|uniref:Uncharacterized protein n=1 Tax=Thelonectria olida TaxID=1576542 RepID=A0A9P8W767_9HYPO|nr:hypothetical protein B0T10DRAFT_485107 [Thelonectria olida]
MTFFFWSSRTKCNFFPFDSDYAFLAFFHVWFRTVGSKLVLYFLLTSQTPGSLLVRTAKALKSWHALYHDTQGVQAYGAVSVFGLGIHIMMFTSVSWAASSGWINHWRMIV